MSAAMTEAERLRSYTKYLDDGRLSAEERRRIADRLRVLTGKGPGDPQLARDRFIPLSVAKT